jgi:hypothetical protein
LPKSSSQNRAEPSFGSDPTLFTIPNWLPTTALCEKWKNGQQNDGRMNKQTDKNYNGRTDKQTDRQTKVANFDNKSELSKNYFCTLDGKDYKKDKC